MTTLPSFGRENVNKHAKSREAIGKMANDVVYKAKSSDSELKFSANGVANRQKARKGIAENLF